MDIVNSWKICKKLEVILLAAALALGMPGHVRAEEGLGGVGKETNSDAGSPAGPPAAPVPAPQPSAAPVSPARPPVSPDPGGAQDEPGEPGANRLSIDNYEIYPANGSKDTLDTVRKGRQVRVLVNVKGRGIRTKDVGKGNISVTKMNDSFRISGSPKVRITSEKDEDLEFTVTFSRLTYLGKDNNLRFRVNFKHAGIPSEALETNIMECEESYPREHGDTGSTIGQPVIKVRRITPQAPVGPGENFTLGLDLENTSSDADIEDMVVSVSPGSSVFISDDTNSRIVSRLESKKTASVKLNMVAGTEITGPSQTIDLELKYNYYSGGNLVSGTSAQKVLIPVRGGSASGQPVIRVGRKNVDKPVNPGEAFQLVLSLQNTSTDKDIRNLSASFEPNDQISLLDETDTRSLGELKAGQSIDVPVRLQAGAELSPAASQLLGMTLKFDYDSDKGAVQGTYSEKIVIPTRGEAKGPGNPTPNVIITNYTYGEKVTAGQVFNLEMEFRNTSAISPVENVVMSMDTGEGISINSSSNTFYIPKLGPGESKKERIQVQALFQSKLQSPKITIACKYEYLDKKERKQSSSNETIAIPVYQPDRFQVREPSFTDVIRQGEETTISIPYVNKGRGQVYNVEAKLEGDIDTLTKDLNLGNFEAGKSGTIDFVATPKKEGRFQGQVIVSYEDETMDVNTVKIPVSFQVQGAAPEMNQNPEDMGMNQKEGRPGLLIWAAAAVPCLAALAVILRINAGRRKRRTNASMAEEAWDELEDMGGENALPGEVSEKMQEEASGETKEKP